MPLFRFQILGVIYFACQVCLFAQVERSSYIHKLFDEKNTWRSSAGFINNIHIESDGRLWIGTDNSLVCWDGNAKLIYDNSLGNPYALNGDRVLDIFEIGDGNMVLYTQQEERQVELLRKGAMNSEIISLDKNGEGLKGYPSDIIMGNDKTVFAAYNERLSLSVYGLDESHFVLNHRFDFGTDISEDVIKIATHKNDIWVVVKGKGVWRSKGEVQELVMDFSTMPNGVNLEPEQFFSDQQGRLWLVLNGVDNNVFLWSEIRFEPFDTPHLNPIDQIELDEKKGMLFVSGEYPDPLDQVFFYNENEWEDYTSFVDSSFISIRSSIDFNSSFLALTKDNITNVEFQPQKVKNYLYQKLDKTIWGHIVKGINEDVEGNIYFLSEIELFKLDKQTNEVEKVPVILADGTVFDFKCGGAIHQDEKGNLWFKVCLENTTGVLIRYQPKENLFSCYHLPDLIRDIDFGSDGKIWVTHHGLKDVQGHLSQFDPEEGQFKGVDLNSTFGEPRFCYSDNDSIVWLGTRKGLVKIDTKNTIVKTYTTENSSLMSDHIICIEEGSGDWLMTGTFGDGLQLFNPYTEKVQVFDKNNGLTDDYVCGIVSVDSSHYWISTFDGMSYFDFNLQTFSNFSVKDGFTHTEFNRYAYFQSRDSTIYLGTVNGANAFNGEDLMSIDYKTNIGLSSIIKYYGSSDTLIQVRNGLENIHQIYLDPDLTYLDLSFYSEDYMKAGRQSIYTKLTPYDDDWVFASERHVRYRLLPPGEYQLQVKGQHSPKILELELIVEIPFYKAWWFNLLVLGGVIGLSFAMYKYRINRMRKEDEARIEVNRKFAELELQALQAQLNPHFVFNALGAIQHTIRDNDTEKAEHFLTSFAVLMRLFLESSKKKLITLAEEIELITRYVELERLRYEDKFDFVFEVEEDIDVHSAEIPSLLFQPFVENAINHGLFHKKERGLLTIKMNEADEILYCSIEDNGVGRKKAGEIRSHSLRKYPSRSTQIVNERLEILQKVQGLNLKIEIQDLPNNGGTKILIEIPLED